MSSILTKLNDDDLDLVRHMIRKDALSDAEIATKVESFLPKKHQKAFVESSPAAKVMVITRYRKSSEYKRWLRNWENRDQDLRKSLELGKQRFELISNLVKDPSSDAIEAVSKTLQARVLTMASEMDDEELLMMCSAKGPVSEILKLVHANLRDTYRRKAEQLKAELTGAIGAAKAGAGNLLDIKTVCDRVDVIMGLKKS